MYKVLFVLENQLALLEEQMNEMAEQGYRATYFLHTNSRLMVVMEYSRGPGRPRKKETDDELIKLGV